MSWPLQPLQPLQNTQLQPPVRPSVDWLCHPWFTTANLSYRFPIFETSATALCGTTGSCSWSWSCSVVQLQLSSYLPIYLSFCLLLCLSVYLPICLPIFFLSISIYIYPYLSISIYIYLYLSICKFKNEAILRDFLNFWPWQHQKRSNSARFPQLLSLTTSKTKLFGETSSIFQLGNIKREAILRDFLQKWKVECRADGLVPMRFAIFPVHVSKVLRLPRKSDARSYEVLHLSRKIIFPNLKIWCSKMQPLSGNQRPDLRTALMDTSLVLRLLRERHLSRSSSNVPRLPSFLKLLQNPRVLLTFDKVHNPLRVRRKTKSERPKVLRTRKFLHFWLRNLLRATTSCTFSTCQLPKTVRDREFLTLLTLKCASRHNGVHFFNISTSKSGPRIACFVHVDLEMCFAPQRRAIFRHVNFQKWSEPGVFCTFWLWMCFGPQRRAIFPLAGSINKIAVYFCYFPESFWRIYSHSVAWFCDENGSWWVFVPLQVSLQL